jgi:hypothetical protein
MMIFRGFGHIAVMCKDVYSECKELEDKGVRFQKRPDEGRMKGLGVYVGYTNKNITNKSTYDVGIYI